jgi:hypothetical protein
MEEATAQDDLPSPKRHHGQGLVVEGVMEEVIKPTKRTLSHTIL